MQERCSRGSTQEGLILAVGAVVRQPDRDQRIRAWRAPCVYVAADRALTAGYRLHLLVATLVVFAAAACELLPAASADNGSRSKPVSWLTHGYDLQRTGYNPSETTIGTSNVSNSSDSVTGKFFHGLVALHADSNCQLSLAWQATVGPNLTNVSSPTVANGIVYYGDGPGNTERAFNAANGALLWSSGSTIHGGLYAAPIVVNGMLYVPAWDDKLYAFGP